MKAILPSITSAKSSEWLKKLNIDLVDAQGNLRDVMQVYTEVAMKMESLSEIEQTQLMEDMAGK